MGVVRCSNTLVVLACVLTPGTTAAIAAVNFAALLTGALLFAGWSIRHCCRAVAAVNRYESRKN